MLILAVNPGSTSTEFGVFDDKKPIIREKIEHSGDELAIPILDQFETRMNCIVDHTGDYLQKINVVSSRGGILYPMEGGVYEINKGMIDDIRHGRVDAQHAANLGILIAYDIKEKFSIPAYMVDPISTDELWEPARVSGLPEIPRSGRTHSLNVRAQARRRAEEMKKPLRDTAFIVVHIGGGLTVNLVKRGKICDVADARQDGPFSPEACGGLSIPDYTKLCFSGRYTEQEMMRFSYGEGGLKRWLDTSSIKEVEERIKQGDKKADSIFRAMAYSTARCIGGLMVCGGKIDSVILTGGGSKSKLLVSLVSEYISSYTTIVVYPGSIELEAIVESTLRALGGEEKIKRYTSRGT